MKLSDLAKKSGLSTKDLRVKLEGLGFGIKATAKTVEDEVAELVIAELSAKPATDATAESTLEIADPTEVADVYDELINQEIEKEIVKSQRKQTAGKDDKKRKKNERTFVHPHSVVAAPSKNVEMSDTISIKELAEKAGISVAKIIGELMKNGILANINQQIDFETLLIISDELGIKLKKKHGAASANEILGRDVDAMVKEQDETVLRKRPPIVVVMGHVDHGKTKLLDVIRSTNVVAGEAGGITQHMGAYQVEKKGKLITFLDTPGHEAFTEMRARGAKVTDIAILVVAADEGVKPQTIEALNHAKEAGVPIIVALNKIDKPSINIERVKGELAEHGLIPEDWGGKTIMAPISALENKGVDELLDMVLLVADMENLRANPDREAVATVVEAHLDPNFGPVATVLVNTGTLKEGDSFVVGSTFGRVKVMFDSFGKRIKEAPPSAPVKIAGLDKTPLSGEVLQVVLNEKIAHQKSEEIDRIVKSEKEKRSSSLNQLISSVQSNKLLKIVLKADTKGSLEAIKGALAKIKDEDVALKIIHSGVGAITESDVMMASASKGFVIGFHTAFSSPRVLSTAENEGVEVRVYKIIYELIDEVRKLLSGLLEPDTFVIELGKAEVKKIFWTKKKEMVVGCAVKGGKLERNAKLRIIKKGELLTDEIILASLQRGENSVNEVYEGEECGIKYTGNVKLEEGDIIEAYKIQKSQRGLGEAKDKPNASKAN